MAHARRGGNALRDIIAFSQRYGIPRRHAGNRRAETISNCPSVGTTLDFPATEMWPAGSGTGGTGGLVIKVIIIFFFRYSKSCQSRESCALGRIAEPRGHHLVREPSCARTSLARRRWFAVPCFAVPCRAVPYQCRCPCRCRAVPCRAGPCRALPCRAVPCLAAPCRAAPRRDRAVPCRAVPCRAVPCRAVPCRAVPCRAVPPRRGRAVPCRALPCRVVPCRAVPCLAVPCRSVPCRSYHLSLFFMSSPLLAYLFPSCLISSSCPAILRLHPETM